MVVNGTRRFGLREPDEVMKLDRMGSFHQSRLSFMRVLLRRMKSENWRFDRPVFDFDENGVGVAVYSAHGPDHSYSLVAFAHDLPPEKRSDRVIAKEWDATFTLFDGVPTQADIDRLGNNVPKQEAGRVSEKELSVSRANRSVRLWEHVVDALAKGQQPDTDKVTEVGYLMRTTAVYGSGKLGAADREMTEDRPEMNPPFQIEMLSVFLTRAFVMDLVEHMAKLRAPDTAVPLDPALRHRFGIGNSTGLGMAPYLMNHPVLLNNWIATREEALARVRNLPDASQEARAEFSNMTARAVLNADVWRSAHPIQIEKLKVLRGDLARLNDFVQGFDWDGDYPWNAIWDWGQSLGVDAQEQLVSLMLEPHSGLVDDLADHMAADENPARRINGRQSVGELLSSAEENYSWALNTDWSEPSQQARVWYTSEEKLEPRLGERELEPVAAYEQPLCSGRDAALLAADLKKQNPGDSVGEFLASHPEHRHIVRRAQTVAAYPYAEIRDNTISAKLLPIDLLRAKLAFFGSVHFDPRSDRWVRINMFQDAPFPEELANGPADDWAFPQLEEVSA